MSNILIKRYENILKSMKCYFTNIDDIMDIYGKEKTLKIIQESNKLFENLYSSDPQSAQDIIELIEEYPALALIIPDYGLQFIELYRATNLTFSIPVASKSYNGDYSKITWLFRPGFNVDLSYGSIFSSNNWENKRMAFGNYNIQDIQRNSIIEPQNFTIVKFFIPQTLPSGIKLCSYHDRGLANIIIKINGFRIRSDNGYSTLSTIPINFNGIINVNEINMVAISVKKSSDNYDWLDFGFY